MNRSAHISECGRHRFRLERSWDASRARLCYVMLNPSTADADGDDPTIRKCVGFAERLGFGAIVVVNLFSFRATDPRELKRAGFPRHAYDDMAIYCAHRDSQTTVLAWGAHARALVRPAEVLDMLRGSTWQRPLKALALTPDGIPRHPLMLPYSRALIDLAAVPQADSGAAGGQGDKP